MAPLPSTAIEAASDLYTGLNIFFSTGFFDNFKNNDFYIFGESYGGKYSLALANIISQDPSNIIQLKGIGMGNAWVVPDVQERVYAKLGYTIGIANYNSYIQLNQIDETCLKLVLNNSYYNAQENACIPLWLNLIGNAGNFNVKLFSHKGL